MTHPVPFARPALAFAVLALLAPAGLASDYHRESLGPTGRFVGAIIVLDGSAGEKDLNPSTKVSGACDVTHTSGPLSGGYSFLCGVDRDDDGFISNVDTGSLDARGFDDDFASAPGGGVALLCFREDVAAAGGEFDDMAVFIGGAAPPSVGTFSIDVDLADDSACTPSSDDSAAFGPGEAQAGSCSQVYDQGTVTTQPCPPDLCGLNQGFVTVEATGPAGGAAPTGVLVCHDAEHNPTGSIATSGGSFDGNGHWNAVQFAPINAGTHPHCLLSSMGAADHAVVQCGKV